MAKQNNKINPVLINKARQNIAKWDFNYKDLKIVKTSVYNWQNDMAALIRLGYKVGVSRDYEAKKEYISCVYPTGDTRRYDELYTPKQRPEMYLDYKYIVRELVMKHEKALRDNIKKFNK